MKENLVLSVQKALGILDLLVFEDPDRQGFKLSTLSEKTRIRPNTLHNLLKTMIAGEYVVQYRNSRYAAGIKTERIGVLSRLKGREVPGGLVEVLKDLRDAIEENVLFCVLSGGQWVRVLEVVHKGAIQVDNNILGNCTIYEKASGRVLIAYCSSRELDQVIDRWGMPGEWWDGIVTHEQLEEGRAAVRRTGYCEMLTVAGAISALGVPVLSESGGLIGAVGSYAPVFRCDRKKKAYIRKRVTEAAAEMQKRMAGT